jgi:hypothetical protein
MPALVISDDLRGASLRGVLIPSGPGCVGVSEAIVLLALTAFHIAEDRALVAALVIHACIVPAARRLGPAADRPAPLIAPRRAS